MLKSLSILKIQQNVFSAKWSSSKAQLLKLRKKTGYPFQSCKKALQLNNNCLEKSEEWLKEEAQRLGWTKANKLASRATLQGIIALAIDDKKELATMVEVNCETDFVARNKIFQSVVDVVTSSCLEFAKKQNILDNSISKVNLESSEMMALNSSEGKQLSDHVAVTIGHVGENIVLRRAICLNTKDTGLNIMGITHPSHTTGLNFFSGKYGSLIVYRKQQNDNKNNKKYLDNSDNEIMRQVCQHVIGMNPKAIGEHKYLEPEISRDVPGVVFNENDDTSLDENKSEIDEKQNILEQDFLLNSSVTVGQIVTDHEIILIDFVRYECGELF